MCHLRQVLKEEETRIFIHYINYSHKFDRWIPKDTVISIVKHPTLPFTAEYIKEQLKLEIKEKLLCRVRQSSEVIIKIDCTSTLYSELFNCTPETSIHPANSELNHLLGQNWHIRIINQHRETCIVLNNSVYIKLKKRQPIVEYIEENNQLKEQHRERVPYLYFSFVRKGLPNMPLDQL